MFKFTAFLILLCSTALSCGPGCLQCTQNSVCRLCDPTALRILTNGTCQLVEAPNCLKIDQNGRCAECNDPYFYLNTVTGNCTSLDFQDMVLFCAKHLGPKNCSYCQPNFYLDGGECKFAYNPVPFCKIQDGPDTCRACEINFYPSPNFRECLSVNFTSNCAQYSTYECARCNDNFTLNKNLYFYNFTLTNTLQTADIQSSFFRLLVPGPFNSPPPVCEKKSVTNCVTADVNGVCQMCSSGYVLSADKTCDRIVLNLAHCSRFLLSNYCLECESGYNLVSPTECRPAATIPGCNYYVLNSNVTKCAECFPGKFSANGTDCQERKFLDQNCKIYSQIFDRCDECNTGYVAVSNGRYCINALPNCANYTSLNVVNTTQLNCSACFPGFYLNTTTQTCFPGTLTNCSIFWDDSPNLCRTCINGNYNLNFTCKPNRVIIGCDTYSQKEKNYCDRCDGNKINMNITTECWGAGNIANCIEYKAPNQCRWCASGYYTAEVTSCVAIPSALNCLNYTGTVCLECKTDYVLTTTGTCRQAISIYQGNCNTTNITGRVSNQTEGCTTCKAGTMPLDYFQWYYCIEDWYLGTTITSTLDANCQNWRIEDESKTYACVRCKTGFFLASSTSCAAGCTATGQTTIYDFIIPTKQAANEMVFTTQLTANACGPTITNCKWASLLVPQTTAATQYVCTECLATHVSMVVPLNVPMALYPHTTSFLQTITYTTLAPQVACEAEADKGLLFIYSNTTKLTPSCEYYYDLPNYPLNTGCLKCQFGYTGRVVDYIANCKTFTGTTCTVCRDFNYPIQSTACQKVWPIPFCSKFDPSYTTSSCLVCDNGYYLKAYSSPFDVNAKYCEACTVQTGCNIYSQVADACATCLTTYFLVGTTCYLLPTRCVTMILNGATPECSVCNSANSYLDGTKSCPLGSITNCATYAAAANTCTVCANGYYLASPTSCVVQAANPQCQTFSQTTAGTCDTCSFDSFKFDVVNQCSAVTTIANCATYLTPTTCQVCTAGFQLNAAMTTCTTVSASLNCQDYAPIDLSGDSAITTADHITGNVFLYSCAKCAVNYMRFATSTSYTLASGATGTVNVYTCVSYFNFVTQNCVGSNNDGTVVFPDVKCTSGCSTGYLPIDWTSRNMCVETAYLTSLSAVVTNCQAYAYDTGTSSYKCTYCANGYFLESNACVSACSGSNFIYLWKLTFDTSPSPTAVLISGQNSCDTLVQTAIDSDCKTVAPAFNLNTEMYACVACKTATNFPLIDFAENIPFTSIVDFNSVSTTLGQKISTPLMAYPAIFKCFDTTAQATSLGTVNASGKVDNCAYYSEFSYGLIPQYGCVRCNIGYTGKTIQETNVDSGYIQSCSADTACDASTVYTGMQDNTQLTTYYGSLFSLFSCHKCTNSAQIPVAFLEVSIGSYKVTKLREYTIPNSSGVSLSSGATGFEMNVVRCLDPSTPSNLGMTTLTNIANCALMIVNVIGGFDASDPSGTDFSKMTAVCVACKPGYSPTYSSQTVFSHIITACTAITNCPTNKGLWLNACSTCSVFGVKSGTNTADYGTCTTNSISNCFVGTNTNCLACKNGYSLSQVNTCVQVTAAYCSGTLIFSNDYMTVGGTSSTGYTLDGSATPFSIHEIFVGCAACTASSTQSVVRVENSGDTNMRIQVCATLASYYTANTSPFNTANCANYGFTGTTTIGCLKCSTGYFLMSDNTCLSNTAYPNCVSVDLATLKCTACVSTSYVMVNYVCTSNSPTAIITDCVAYTAATRTSAQATCETCASYKVPAADGLTCVAFNTANFPNCVQVDIAQTTCTKCAPFYIVITYLSGSYCYPIGQISGTSPTQPDHDNNCLDYNVSTDVTQSFQSFKLTCTQCKTNYILTTTANTYVNYCYKFFVTSLQPAHCSQFYVSQPLLSSFTFECMACAPVATYYFQQSTKTCQTRTAVTNCQTYTPNADTCQTCQTGYDGSGTLSCTLPFVPKNTLTNNIGYIEECKAMTTCSANKFYGGLSPLLSKIFSCHECSTTGQIPFAFISGGDPYSNFIGLKEYGITGINPPAAFSGNVNGTAIQCLAPTAASFQITASKFSFPNNCGLGFVNVDSQFDASASSSSSNVDLTKIAVFCVACLPKFTPSTATSTGGSTIPVFVSSCQTIANCASSNTFNGCDQCSPGYVLQYTVGVGISTTTCITFAGNTNCLAAISSSSPCQVCQIGYYINRDGKCELLNSPSCTTALAGIWYNTVDVPTMVTMTPFSGCNLCAAGFYSIYSPKHLNICTTSPYLPTQNPASSNYVPYCAIYSSQIYATNLICMACNTGYILTTSGKCTALVTALANCFVAQTATQCGICNSGYANVDSICVTASIKNCQIYFPLSTGDQSCLVCAEGYYLQDNKCFEGKISGCLIYQGYDICLVCQSGTVLTKLQNRVTQCFPIPYDMSCSYVDPILYHKSIWQCTKCQPGRVPVALASSDQYSFCYDFPKDIHCRYNDINYNIGESTFVCRECLERYFLSQNQGRCFPRMLSYNNCEKLNLYQDTCDVCARGFQLDSLRSGCIPLPVQIVNCIQYNTTGKCVMCASGTYLKNELCVTVEKNMTIANCQDYDSNQKCYQCMTGYFNYNGTCVVAEANNCVTYLSPKVCLTCSPGFGIKTENGISSCVYKSIANCVKSTNYYPFHCTRCETGYYPNPDGVCARTNTTITGCRYYSQQGACETCFDGFLLSSNSSECVPKSRLNLDIELNCQALSLADSGTCSVCADGYYFKDNQCVQCYSGNDQSCRICDPNGTGGCLVCSLGYYQLANGTCVTGDSLITFPQSLRIAATVGSCVIFKAAMFVVGLVLAWIN
jgi:hypothetical protein